MQALDRRRQRLPIAAQCALEKRGRVLLRGGEFDGKPARRVFDFLQRKIGKAGPGTWAYGAQLAHDGAGRHCGNERAVAAGCDHLPAAPHGFASVEAGYIDGHAAAIRAEGLEQQRCPQNRAGKQRQARQQAGGAHACQQRQAPMHDAKLQPGAEHHRARAEGLREQREVRRADQAGPALEAGAERHPLCVRPAAIVPPRSAAPHGERFAGLGKDGADHGAPARRAVARHERGLDQLDGGQPLAERTHRAGRNRRNARNAG